MFSLGIIKFNKILRLRRLNGLDGHPDVRINGIEFNTGSLGMGISKAKGISWAKKYLKKKGLSIVITGDGEFQEGQIYESLQTTSAQNIKNLLVIMDHNKIQSSQFVKDIINIEPLVQKIKSFGWHVERCNGNSMVSLSKTLKRILKKTSKPKFLIADTIKGKGISFMIPAVIILVTGCVFAMWLGEKITDRGIGNGISLLITVGIIASLPLSFAQEFVSQISGSGGLLMIAIESVIWVIVIALCVLLVKAVRQIPVQYARRSVVSGQNNMFSKRQYIPLRLNASGVMPIIFAQAIMFAPAYLGQIIGGGLGQWMQSSFSNMFGLAYNILFGLLIILFTYFYTAITVPTNKMADDLKRSGGFVPGIKPGLETSDFLDKVMSLITFPGSIFLALISVLPAVIVALM